MSLSYALTLIVGLSIGTVLLLWIIISGNSEQTSVDVELNPWLSIWTRPRPVIRQLVDREDPTYLRLHGLAALGGILIAMNRASQYGLGEEIPLTTLPVLIIMLGAVLGVLLMYLNAALLSWVGRFMGGEASPQEIMTAYAWSNVPSVAALGIVVLQVVLLGGAFFWNDSPDIAPDTLLSSIVPGLFVLEVVLTLWAFVLFLNALGEVQGFSTGKAMRNIILGFLPLLLPMFFLLMIAGL
jgi:hypothetical protein